MMHHTGLHATMHHGHKKPPLSNDKGGGAQFLFEVVLKMLTDIGSTQAAQGL
jgi:hypothetical protein